MFKGGTSFDMLYYRISEDLEDDRAASIDIQHLRADGSWHDIWIYGRCVEAVDFVPFQFLYDGGELRDFNLATPNIPLVSSRFKELILPIVGTAVQFIRTSVANETLFVMNVLERYDALDLQTSVVTRRKRTSAAGAANEITGIVDLRVDPSRASWRPIFRLEKWGIPIIVCEEIQKIAVEERISGAVFERVA